MRSLVFIHNILMLNKEFYSIKLFGEDVMVYLNKEKMKYFFQKGVVCGFNDIIVGLYGQFVGNETLPFDSLFNVLEMKYLGKKYAQNLLIQLLTFKILKLSVSNI